MKLCKMSLSVALGIPHSSVDCENLLPRSARMILECERGVHTGIIVIPSSRSKNLMDTTSCYILDLREPRERKMKLFFESVCQ